MKLSAIAAMSGRGILPVSRETVCATFPSWQGLKVDGVNFWDPMLAEMNPQQRQQAYAAKRAAGNTHVMLTLDMRGMGSVPEIHALAKEALQAGFFLQLMCMGDGFNGSDPGALGFDWLMGHFQEIYTAFYDIAETTVFVPGFDGVVPGWQPFTKVNQFVRLARSVIDRGGRGYLGLELSSGYCVWSGEDNDWATPDGQCVDVIIQEFPIGMANVDTIPPDWLQPNGDWQPWVTNEMRAPYTEVYQMVGRMVSPYHMPPKQPDDHNAPFLLGSETPRGPYLYCCGEQSTYEWIRAQSISLAEVNSRRDYLRSMGASLVC